MQAGPSQPWRRFYAGRRGLSRVCRGLAGKNHAVMQEVIDVLAVLNALRMALPPRSLTDY
jgi:hypothetical protein